MPWPSVADILVGEAFTEKGICSSWKQESNIELADATASGSEGLQGGEKVAARAVMSLGTDPRL